MPVLAIVGLLDMPGTAIQGAILEERVPRARRVDVPGVAHVPNLERPEWFTETLLAFLDEVEATA